MSRKRERRANILAGTVACVFLVILAGQAILRIRSGDMIGGFNYFGQPVPPVLQLILVLVCVIVIAVSAWRYWRGERGGRKNEKPGREPDWMRQPPYKFPWE
jgi:hypothetical protein